MLLRPLLLRIHSHHTHSHTHKMKRKQIENTQLLYIHSISFHIYISTTLLNSKLCVLKPQFANSNQMQRQRQWQTSNQYTWIVWAWAVCFVLSCAVLCYAMAWNWYVLSYMYTYICELSRARRIRAAAETQAADSCFWMMMLLFSLHKFVEQSCWHYYDCLWFFLTFYKPFEQPVCFLHSFICSIVCLFVIVVVIIDVISFKNDTWIAVWFYWRCCCAAAATAVVVFSRWFSRQSFQVETSTCFGFFA